jgi:hypothetical protein
VTFAPVFVYVFTIASGFHHLATFARYFIFLRKRQIYLSVAVVNEGATISFW